MARCLIGGALLAAMTGCDAGQAHLSHVPGGDARAGRIIIEEYDCGTCHVIPGIEGPEGIVGPPLAAWSRHVYIAGKFPNDPDVLVRWLLDPPALASDTAMPDLGLSEDDARDAAAYLYTLR